MFTDYKFLFTHTYASRWDFKLNTDKMSLSYYENEGVYYVGNDDMSFNMSFKTFTEALRCFVQSQGIVV